MHTHPPVPRRPQSAPCRQLAFSVASLLTVSLAQADVTLRSTMSVDGTGPMAVAGMTASMTEIISGDRARSETQIKFNTALIRLLARGAAGAQTEITRLDRDKVYHLDVKKRRYSERSLADLRAQIDKVQDQTAQTRMPLAFDDSQCEWSSPHNTMQRGANETVAGFDSQRWTVKSSQTCTNKQTREQCDLALTMDLWIAKSLPGGDEQQHYYRRYAEKLGLTGNMSRATYERAQSLVGRYQGMWNGLTKQLAGVKGHPVRTDLSLTLGEGSCTSNKTTESEDSRASTEGEVAKKVARDEIQIRTGRTSLGHLGELLTDRLMSKRKKESTSEANVAQTNATPSGVVALIRINYRLDSISSDVAARDAFEVPAEFKKTGAF